MASATHWPVRLKPDTRRAPAVIVRCRVRRLQPRGLALDGRQQVVDVVPLEQPLAQGLENGTPLVGPLSSPAVVGAGGKCCCTIMLAVRVENALPPLER
jgi:hypothetical protein